MKKISFAILSLSMIFLFSACQSQTQTPNNNKTEEVVLEPEQTYLNNCASCHGQSLEGNIGPSLEKIGSKMGKDEISQIIENGKGSMPSQSQVSAEAREQLSNWLAEKK